MFKWSKDKDAGNQSGGVRRVGTAPVQAPLRAEPAAVNNSYFTSEVAEQAVRDDAYFGSTAPNAQANTTPHALTKPIEPTRSMHVVQDAELSANFEGSMEDESATAAPARLDEPVRKIQPDAMQRNRPDVPNTDHVPERRNDPLGRQFIDELEKRDWRGVLLKFVSEANRDQCVVCCMGLRTVCILVTEAFYPTGYYQSLISELKKNFYVIEKEVQASSGAIARTYEIGSQKKQSFLSNTADHDDKGYQLLYDDLIAGAYKLKASDIHIEINNDGDALVRLRIFGRMRDWKRYPADLMRHTVSAGYMSKSKLGTNSGGNFSPDRGMSTMTTHKVGGVTIEGRFSSLPSVDGCDVVIRLLVTDQAKKSRPSLEELGYAPSQIRLINAALKKNSGLLMISGSTGSGKTTTLATMLDIVPRKKELKRVAIEDPVEIAQEGVRKFSIQRGPDDPEHVVKQKFLATLRQQMRMDPDLVEIGEIRDNESGSIACEFVQTGHRVLATIHGDGAVDSLARAAGELIAIPTEILAMRKFVALSMYQKLVPVLCDCKVPAIEALDAEQIELIKEKYKLDPRTMSCANENGCEECRVPGIADSGGTKGQTVCAEILVPNGEMREGIRNRTWNAVENLWRAERKEPFGDINMEGKTAFEHALYKASIGMVDIRDIEADFESLHTYEVNEIHSGAPVASIVGIAR